jgi:hypothetical protein
MSETKFTPGPWSKKAIGAALRAAHKHDGSWIDELGDGENMPDEDDASLIAAAPEMYQALTLACAAVADVTHCGGDDCTDCEVGTALRKARGEA